METHFLHDMTVRWCLTSRTCLVRNPWEFSLHTSLIGWSHGLQSLSYNIITASPIYLLISNQWCWMGNRLESNLDQTAILKTLLVWNIAFKAQPSIQPSSLLLSNNICKAITHYCLNSRCLVWNHINAIFCFSKEMPVWCLDVLVINWQPANH